MSELKEPCPVRLIIGLIYCESALIDSCIKKLTSKFGQINYISQKLPFDYTKYYETEMGKTLTRKILSFSRLIKRDSLVDIKLFTNNLENEFMIYEKRTINIDPGYIAKEHLILSTGKGYYHRPYLGKGVYADLTLVYKNKQFHGLEWTYPDYNSESMKILFKQLRQGYIKQLVKESYK